MSRSSDRSYLWVFYTAAGFLFAGTVLRSVALAIGDEKIPLGVFPLLLVWLALFVSEPFISRLWRPWFAGYLVVQTAIVVALLFVHDLYAALFAVLSMHAMLRYGLRWGALWLVLFVPLTAVPLLWNPDYDPPEVAALTLVYAAANVLLGSYALASRRAAEARRANDVLAREMRSANAELEDYSRRLEGLAVAQERNRLARELHDSVTQTIFSMTLASQSAALLLDRDPAAADGQLDRLSQLAQSALAEMHTLVAELSPDVTAGSGLRGALRREVERRDSDGHAGLSRDRGVHRPACLGGGCPVTAGGAGSAPDRPGEPEQRGEALRGDGGHRQAAADGAGPNGDRGPREGFRRDRGEVRTGLWAESMSQRAAEIGWDSDFKFSGERHPGDVAERLSPEGG